jgi:hypothetical protein
MPLKLNTASSGSVTIDAANTASNFTLTVPAQTGTVIASDSSGNVGINTNSPDGRLDINGIGVLVGTKTASSGLGGNIRMRNDTGTVQWTTGVLGGSAATDWSVFNNVSSAIHLNLTTSGNFQFNSGYGSSATAYGCRAWVNFNGTGTVAIRNSGNVSSITDNGTGDYTVNFTNAMPDVNYCVGLTADFAQQMVKSAATFGGSGTNPTTSAIRVFTRDGGSSASDSTHVFVSIFR